MKIVGIPAFSRLSRMPVSFALSIKPSERTHQIGIERNGFLDTEIARCERADLRQASRLGHVSPDTGSSVSGSNFSRSSPMADKLRERLVLVEQDGRVEQPAFPQDRVLYAFFYRHGAARKIGHLDHLVSGVRAGDGRSSKRSRRRPATATRLAKWLNGRLVHVEFGSTSPCIVIPQSKGSRPVLITRPSSRRDAHGLRAEIAKRSWLARSSRWRSGMLRPCPR